jgi:hypothetical protein
MASPSLRDNFAGTVELYSTFIKQMKIENTQLNVFDVSFARGKAGKNSYIKRHSQAYKTLHWMTGFLRSMNTIISPLIRRIC